MGAEKQDWQNLPFEEMKLIPYSATFSGRKYNKIAAGLIPQVMEDKWFIYMDGPYLCLHRSWTGLGVYRIKLEGENGDYFVTEAACASSVLQHSNPEYQAELLDFLISNLLLGKNKPFPKPEGVGAAAGIYQHHIAGTGYPETVVPPVIPEPKPWWKFWLR